MHPDLLEVDHLQIEGLPARGIELVIDAAAATALGGGRVVAVGGGSLATALAHVPT